MHNEKEQRGGVSVLFTKKGCLLRGKTNVYLRKRVQSSFAFMRSVTVFTEQIENIRVNEEIL